MNRCPKDNQKHSIAHITHIANIPEVIVGPIPDSILLLPNSLSFYWYPDIFANELKVLTGALSIVHCFLGRWPQSRLGPGLSIDIMAPSSIDMLIYLLPPILLHIKCRPPAAPCPAWQVAKIHLKRPQRCPIQ